jgi:DNA processing protein
MHDQLAFWTDAPRSDVGRVITPLSPDYPGRSTPGPPVLVVEGDLAALAEGVAIVGTRACSPHGAQCAHRIAFALARAGVPVISGLARGIDSHAHRGALDGGGRTVAVLGHGLSFTAPLSNEGLRRRIVESGGACVSTWPDAVPPGRHTFPERNEWIAWLAREVVLIECPPRSGALITATHAAAHGRRMWVVPGPAFDPRWSGTRDLLELDDTMLLHDLDFFMETVAGERPQRRESWLESVVAGVPLPDVAQAHGRPVTELFRELALLELEGAVTRLPGGRWGAASGESARRTGR